MKIVVFCCIDKCSKGIVECKLEGRRVVNVRGAVETSIKRESSIWIEPCIKPVTFYFELIKEQKLEFNQACLRWKTPSLNTPTHIYGFQDNYERRINNKNWFLANGDYFFKSVKNIAPCCLVTKYSLKEATLDRKNSTIEFRHILNSLPEGKLRIVVIPTLENDGGVRNIG